MEKTVHQRFAEMIVALNMSVNKFAVTLEMPSTQLYNIIKGRNAPSYDTLQKIALKFPTVNMVYLLTEKGEPLTVDAEFFNKSVDVLAKIAAIDGELKKMRKDMSKEKKKTAVKVSSKKG